MNLREWALPVYTILMQMAVGALSVLWVIRWLASSKFTKGELDRMIRNPILVITLTSVLAMGGAHFHLSKPFLSFLAILNIQTSWLSREILFSVLFSLATAGLWYFSRYKTHHQRIITSLGWMGILFGLIVVYCMTNIYILPAQEVWNSRSMIFSFNTTTLLLGCMMMACLMMLDLKFAEIQDSKDIEIHARLIRYSFKGLSFLAFGSVLLDIGITLFQISMLREGDVTAQSSLSLLLELYLPLLILRGILLIYASISIVYFVNRMYRQNSPPQGIMMPVYLSSLFIIVGEIIGRFLFYAIHIRIGI
jgi:anaerobic dimethyl sulfoxide reductase subunit C (anchor subunit)